LSESSAPAGLLKEFLATTPLKGLGLTPRLTQNEIVIELTDRQLRDMLLANADPRARGSVSVECHEGKLMIKIRLW